MQRILIASLMALFFGLFSIPASQAAPANGQYIELRVALVQALASFPEARQAVAAVSRPGYGGFSSPSYFFQ
jgi:hypothetical protein